MTSQHNNTHSPFLIVHLTLALTLALSGLIGASQPVQAATRVVTSSANIGSGSLRALLESANAGDTITFSDSLSGGTIRLSSNLIIDKNLTIDASTLAAPITLNGDSDNSGSGDTLVLRVNSGVTVSLNSLNITEGTNRNQSGDWGVGGGIYIDHANVTLNNCAITNSVAGEGGGIYNDSGTLTINHCILDNNTAYTGGAGGIENNKGTVTLSNSVVSNNHAIINGGGIYTLQGSFTVTNTTFASNKAEINGGGIFDNQSTLLVKNSTFSNNIVKDGDGGGIFSDSGGGSLDLKNSILANTTDGKTDCYNLTSVTSANNLIVNNHGCGTPISTADPLLGSFGNHGGPGSTFALQEGSPAIDSGDATSCTETDQRGAERPQGSGCDLGAYESGAPISKPDITYSDPSGIDHTSATIHGSVRPNNLLTKVYFEYGLTNSYGNRFFPANNQIYGNTNTPFSYSLTNLNIHQTYHYRLVAVNSSGTTYGDDMVFTTSPVLATATTNDATGVTGTSAGFNGTVNPQNAATNVTFEYGFDTTYGKTVSIANNPVSGTTNAVVSVTLNGLIPNQVYHFRVVAENAAGITYGEDSTFTTTLVAPSAQTLAAANINLTGATLNGTVNPQNASTTVSFEYGLDKTYGKVVPFASNPILGAADTPVSLAISDLLPQQVYHYRVVATNAGGVTYGEDQTFQTILVPTAITGAADHINGNKATVNAAINPQGAPTTVSFEYGLDDTYGETVLLPGNPFTGGENIFVSVTLDHLLPNRKYHYRVIATNTAGTSYGADYTFTTLSNIYLPTIIR